MCVHIVFVSPSFPLSLSNHRIMTSDDDDEEEEKDDGDVHIELTMMHMMIIAATMRMITTVITFINQDNQNHQHD